MQLVNGDALSGMSKARRLRAASHEAQPWHSVAALTPAFDDRKVRQMRKTPRGEPDKLPLAARKTGFDEIYLLCADQCAPRSGTLPDVRRTQRM